MRILYFIFFLILLLTFCLNNSKKKTPDYIQANLKDTFKKDLKQILIDSLYSLSNSSDTIIHDNSSKYMVFITQLNNQKIGVITITDSDLFIFKQTNKSWIQADSIAWQDYISGFSVTDLNGDRINDLIVYGFGNMHGQAISYVFLCDNKNTLTYRPDIHLFNIRFDSSKKLIQSYYQGGITSINHKEYYQWINDSLRLIQGVEQDLSSGKNITTTFYRQKKGIKYIYRKTRDNQGKIYDTALWKKFY